METEPSITRRTLLASGLKVAGAAGIAALTGCGLSSSGATHADAPTTDAATTDAATTDAATTDAATTQAATTQAATTQAATTQAATTQAATTQAATTQVATTQAATKSSDGGKTAAPHGTVLAKVSDIPVGNAVSATLNGKPILISQPTAGAIVAFSAICTHMGCTVMPAGKEFHCPCHGSVYNAATGAVKEGPAPLPLAKVAVHVSGGEVMSGS